MICTLWEKMQAFLAKKFNGNVCVLQWNHRKEYWYRRSSVIESSFKFKSNPWWTMELCVKNQEVVPQPAINSCLNLTRFPSLKPLPSLCRSGRSQPTRDLFLRYTRRPRRRYTSSTFRGASLAPGNGIGAKLHRGKPKIPWCLAG